MSNRQGGGLVAPEETGRAWLDAGMDAPGPYSIGSDHWPGLSKLVEECGEVIQVAGKLLGSGGKTKHWNSDDLSEDLWEEMADVVAAVRFVVRHNLTEAQCGAFTDRAQHKLRLFEQWHRDTVGTTSVATGTSREVGRTDEE